MLNNTPAPPEEVADKLGISVYKEFFVSLPANYNLLSLIFTNLISH